MCALIAAAGAEAVHLPAIEIHEAGDSGQLDSVLQQLETFQLAVFVSVNAGHACLPYILARRNWPQQVKLATVGPTSTQAIEGYGLRVDYVPEHEFSSEGLLAVDGLLDMHDKKVVIFRGNGGRSKLYDSFTARGARVVYAEVYSRSCPVADYQTVIALLQQDGLDIVTAASNETLQNLFVMAGPQGQPVLREKQLVVPGQRELELAEQLGFTRTPLIAGNASDEAMMSVLEKIISRRDAEAQR